MASADQGPYTTFTILGSPNGQAWGINNFNQIVGFQDTFPTSLLTHGFLRNADGGALHRFDVPSAGVTQAYGINDNGEMSGYFIDSNFVTRGFVASHDFQFQPFDVPGSMVTQAFGMNNNGLVVGQFSFTDQLVHGFVRFPDGSFDQFDFPDPTTVITAPIALDTFGNCVGSFTTIVNNIRIVHGFLVIAPDPAVDPRFPPNDSPLLEFFPHGRQIVIDTPIFGATSTTATGINDAGVIVGFFGGPDGVDHGFLLVPPGVPLALGPQAVPMGPPFPTGFMFNPIEVPGARFTDIFGINNAHTIVGAASGPDDLLYHPFVACGPLGPPCQ
jgi:hypothetical protein